MATKFPFRVRIVNLVMLWTEIAITFAIILIAIIIVLDYVRYLIKLYKVNHIYRLQLEI